MIHRLTLRFTTSLRNRACRDVVGPSSPCRHPRRIIRSAGRPPGRKLRPRARQDRRARGDGRGHHRCVHQVGRQADRVRLRAARRAREAAGNQRQRRRRMERRSRRSGPGPADHRCAAAHHRRHHYRFDQETGQGPDRRAQGRRWRDAAANASSAKLAQFYSTGVRATRCWARGKDALADGLPALAVGKGAIGSCRSRTFGDSSRCDTSPRRSGTGVTGFNSMVREGNRPGVRGTLINALANMAGTLVSMGDVGQATTYAGRVEALFQEARGSQTELVRSSAFTVIPSKAMLTSARDGVRGTRPICRS